MLIAKEITKMHETYIRGYIDDFKIFNKPLKGELTVIISEKNIKLKKRYMKKKLLIRQKNI